MLTLRPRMARGGEHASRECLGRFTAQCDGARILDERSLPMRAYWMAGLGLVALLATEGCKQKSPEPIPGPKAASVGMMHPRAAGIAWFQGSLDEAFARPGVHVTCSMERAPMAPLTPDLSRARTRAPSPAHTGTGRRPLV